MGLDHLVVAVDESEASREAVRAALGWAGRSGARVTVFHVAAVRAVPAMVGDMEPFREPGDSLAGIERWLDAEMARHPGARPPQLVGGLGLPSVEIPRFAEEQAASLVVLGRKQRSQAIRLVGGDTADAVARRSRVPCLFVPGPLGVPRWLLVALDGTDRGRTVLGAAQTFAAALGAEVAAVTVEPIREDEPPELASTVRAGRTLKLERELQNGPATLRTRRGDIVQEILSDVKESLPDVLVVGFHRGGPPAVIEAGSVARRLAHLAPCAVLTIPL
ncbi:MAG TPA: universal stress protein [Gemmatimonadales bacterium]|nr:universal stress protein [Gemmatimonadales bacterium]